MWQGGRVSDSEAAGTARDVRVCFAGDSFVAGVGDGSGLGWVGRMTAHAQESGLPITAYNLGIRGNTSADVAARLPDEVSRRASPAASVRVVLAYGLNDVVLVDGQPRMAAEDSVAATSRSLSWLAASRFAAVLVGPPLLGDADIDARAGRLDGLLAECAAAHGRTYISVFRALAGNPVWLKEVREGDGAHPDAGGYQQYFEAVRAPLLDFLA
jgi:lysophospholipase L1-like esterase